jgi:hypothetical protein
MKFIIFNYFSKINLLQFLLSLRADSKKSLESGFCKRNAENPKHMRACLGERVLSLFADYFSRSSMRESGEEKKFIGFVAARFATTSR